MNVLVRHGDKIVTRLGRFSEREYIVINTPRMGCYTFLLLDPSTGAYYSVPKKDLIVLSLTREDYR